MDLFNTSSLESEEENKEEGTSALAKGVLALLILAGGGWYLYGGGLDMHAEQELDRINDQVATDFEAQYRMSKQGGDLIEICVQAQTVAAAYLQAQDQNNYMKWKDIEKTDCAKAGL